MSIVMRLVAKIDGDEFRNLWSKVSRLYAVLVSRFCSKSSGGWPTKLSSIKGYWPTKFDNITGYIGMPYIPIDAKPSDFWFFEAMA